VAGGNSVGSKQELVLVDTNIFVIDLHYKKDVHYDNNLAFLTAIAQKRTGFTTIVNLLELCGILSFNLNEKQLYELWFYFQDRYKVTVQPAATIESNFPAIGINEIFDLLKKRSSLGDALMIAVARKHLAFISTLVTWDDDHFKGKFPGTVLTPEEFLKLEKRRSPV
jgi:predicted nucleic acid-binding protein